jgi:hypothetical protein
MCGFDPCPDRSGDRVLLAHEGGEEQPVRLALEQQLTRQAQATAGAEQHEFGIAATHLPPEYPPLRPRRAQPQALDTWERRATDEVLERVERRGGDPRAKARRAGALTFSDELLPVDLAVRDWARHDPAVAERLRRVDNRRMEYLRTQFRAICTDEDEVEARCLLAFSLLLGDHLITADHGPRSREAVLKVAARWLLA